MKISVSLVVFFFLLSVVDSARTEDFSQNLDVTIKSEGKPTIWNIYALVQNHSNSIICIDSSNFGKFNTSLMLRDSSGKQVVLQRSVEGIPDTAPPTFHWDKSYFFVRPQETRKVWLDLTNYLIKGGVYSYGLNFYFFKCSDVLDQHKKIISFAAGFHGKVSIISEK